MQYREELKRRLQRHLYVVSLRRQLLVNGTLVRKDGFLTFTKDVTVPRRTVGHRRGRGTVVVAQWRERGNVAEQRVATAAIE